MFNTIITFFYTCFLDIPLNSVVACLRPSGSIEMREKQLEETMAKYNAVYTLLWKKDADGFFRVVNEYTTQARKRSHSSTNILASSFCVLIMTFDSFPMHTALRRTLKELRGDDKTFAGCSSQFVRPTAL